jgi:hypothetical protein
LMNEVTFVESARVLAQRVMTSAATPADRIARAFRLALARQPTGDELTILEQGFARHLDRFRQHPAEADKLLQVGEAPRAAALDSAELAALTTVANLILNLDEAVTKE